MRGNKSTVIKANVQLAALTERILGQMGKEGAAIRRKLQLFYRRRHGPLCVVGARRCSPTGTEMGSAEVHLDHRNKSSCKYIPGK